MPREGHCICARKRDYPSASSGRRRPDRVDRFPPPGEDAVGREVPDRRGAPGRPARHGRRLVPGPARVARLHPGGARQRRRRLIDEMLEVHLPALEDHYSHTGPWDVAGKIESANQIPACCGRPSSRPTTGSPSRCRRSSPPSSSERISSGNLQHPEDSRCRHARQTSGPCCATGFPATSPPGQQ